MAQPQDFNIFKIYSKVAEDLNKENPIVSYYLKTYTLNKALEYLKAERSQGKDVSDRTQEIKVWLQDLENCKATMNDQLSDKEHCKQIFKDFTQNLYQKSDHDYKTANYTRTLARDFLYVSVLYDAWELLGAQTEETKEKKNYSNQARFKIMDALVKGIQPQPVVTNQNQPQPETPKPTNNPTKEEGPVDPMSKINFALTESIVVPQNSIDKFLGPNTKKPENHENKPTDGHIHPNVNANLTQPNNYTKWNLPVGKSMAFDENAPPVTNPQHLDPHHQQFNPITRQKTPPTVFYAPRQTPSIEQNLNPKPTPTVDHTPTGTGAGETTPHPHQNKPEEIMETPGEGEKPTPNVSIISKKQESHHNIKDQGTPQHKEQNIHQSIAHQNFPQSTAAFENTQSKIQEQYQSSIKPNQLENTQAHQSIIHPATFENTQSKVQEQHQSIIKPDQSQHITQPTHFENTQSKFQEHHQSTNQFESGQSKIQETHQINPNETHFNQVSQNIPQNTASVFGNTQHKVQELQQSIIKPSEAYQNHQENHQSRVSQNLLPQPQNVLLENAKPATSTFAYDQPEHLPSVQSNIHDTENKVLPQNNLETQSIKTDSVAPANPQSVFKIQNQSHFSNQPSEAGQSHINQASNFQGENINPNSSNIQGSNQGNGDDKVLKCKGVKDICLRAIIDLNATNVKEARQKIQQALQILNEME